MVILGDWGVGCSRISMDSWDSDGHVVFLLHSRIFVT